MRAPGHGARPGGLLDSGREVPAVPDNIVLIMRFHPVGGEDVSVVSEDFGGEREALEAIAQALDDRRSLVLTQARYDREGAGNHGQRRRYPLPRYRGAGVRGTGADRLSHRPRRNSPGPSGRHAAG